MDFQFFASVMVIEAKDYSGHGTVMCQSMMEVPHHPCDPSCDGEIMCAPVYDNQMYLFHADDGTNQVRSNRINAFPIFSLPKKLMFFELKIAVSTIPVKCRPFRLKLSD